MLGWVIPHVSNAAHLGGMLAGFVLTFCFFERGRGIEDAVTRWARAGWIALLVSTTLYTCVPTARFDYLARKADAARDAAAQRPYLEALLLLPRSEIPDDLRIQIRQELERGR